MNAKCPAHVVLTMDATPETRTDGKGLIEWYTTETGYLNDFFTDFAKDEKGTMTFNKETGCYEVRFVPNEYWPKDVKEQARKAAMMLENPDDDGNYLIGREFVAGKIRSIQGVEFYEWKDITLGKRTNMKFVLKSEYEDVL
jgi:hypothetical protein